MALDSGHLSLQRSLTDGSTNPEDESLQGKEGSAFALGKSITTPDNAHDELLGASGTEADCGHMQRIRARLVLTVNRCISLSA